MAHKLGMDDQNIVAKCREFGFCCTYDEENPFTNKSVKDAIADVLASRAVQSEKLDRLIKRTVGIMEPLQKLIDDAEELSRISGKGVERVVNVQDGIGTYLNQLVEKRDCLDDNLRKLEKAKRVMDRKYIHVPVVGVINSGKSTFLHSALGGNINDKKKENLFPSAGDLKSCTGTRTVLIYDSHTEGVRAVAKFKDQVTFLRDSAQSVRRMIEVLEAEELEDAGQFVQIRELKKDLVDGADPVALLKVYASSSEFKTLCNIRYKDERHAESVHDFCSFVYFSKNQDYAEDRMDMGTSKNVFDINDLVKSWKEGKSYHMEIPEDRDFEQVKSFVCKYNPDMEKNVERYTTYCGVEVVEIRGNLCGEIAGLELIDSVGANDDAISNTDQMEALMQDSDAVVLLERPQAQARGGWSVTDYIRFIKEQKKAPDQFLYLVYNCYHNNMTTPSELSHGLDRANQYYSDGCRRIYVSDISEWEEVQSKILVDMLVNLSNSVEKTHEEYLHLAKKANAEISDSVFVICKAAENIGQICSVGEENASEKKMVIDGILKALFGGVEKLIFEIGDERETTMKISANQITQNLIKNIKIDTESVDFPSAYEYMSPTGPGYVYNRYTAFLCLYSHMLEDARRQYRTLQDDIHTYVEGKRAKLLGILWKEGCFQQIMADSGFKVPEGEVPKAAYICEWLRKDTRELLADVLENLLLQDIDAEALVDGSIGKVIDQFDPKNLTAEQLFGQPLSDPNLENNENSKASAIVNQLTIKAKELEAALFKSVSGDVENPADPAKTGNRNAEKKKGDDNWDNVVDRKNKNNVRTSDYETVQDSADESEHLFDLDRKVRKDVVCDDILKKFRDKLRGDGLQPNAEQQLYNLYDRYYDRLLSEKEVSEKKQLRELRVHAGGLAVQLIGLCRKWQNGSLTGEEEAADLREKASK